MPPPHAALRRAWRPLLPPGARAAAAAADLSRLPTAVDKASPDFQANKRRMDDEVARLRSLVRAAQNGGNEVTRRRHVARGKMLPRDRVHALIDFGSSFLELSPLAGHQLYSNVEVPAGGIIAGVGLVKGVSCVIVANDSTVKGGTYYPITVKKHLRAQEVARQNNLPCVSPSKPFPLRPPRYADSRSPSPSKAASTSSTRAAQTSPTRPTSSPTRTTLAASSTTRPACRPPPSPRSPSSWAPAPPAAPTCPP